jgi:hypothetical protein
MNLNEAVHTCLRLNMSVLMANEYAKVSTLMKAVSGTNYLIKWYSDEM